MINAKLPGTRRLRSRRGLSLIEVIVSLILVSTILLVSISASANLMRDRSIARNSIAAHELAGEILDEISVRHFRDTDDNAVFGLEPDEAASTRATFDDIDDYDGYSDSPPTYRDGPTIDGYAGWTFQVAVVPAEATATGITVTQDEDASLRLVTVVCMAANGATRSESIVVSEISSEVDPSTSFDRMRRVSLGFSADRQVNFSVPLRNQPTAVPNE